MTAEALEQQLHLDLVAAADRIATAKAWEDLYRALARNVWRKQGSEGHVSLSWSRAEEIVNEVRGGEPLTLAQTGGEGEVSRLVEDELGRLGWSHRPLNTGRGDPEHTGQTAESAPPASREGGEPPEWERRAHAEADERGRTIRPRPGPGD